MKPSLVPNLVSLNSSPARFLSLGLAAAVLFTTFALAVQGVQGQTASVTNSLAGIFDESDGTRDFDFSSSGLSVGNPITEVTISLTFAKNPEFPGERPFYNEMQFILSNPGGALESFLIDLDSFDIGDNDAFFNGTINFDDSAAEPVNTDVNQPLGGTFQPISPLSIFNGTAFVAGTWTLAILDNVAGAPLTFTSATLTITTAIPEPATSAMLLLGAALVSGAAWKRRRAQLSNSKS